MAQVWLIRRWCVGSEAGVSGVEHGRCRRAVYSDCAPDDDVQGGKVKSCHKSWIRNGRSKIVA